MGQNQERPGQELSIGNKKYGNGCTKKGPALLTSAMKQATAPKKHAKFLMRNFFYFS